MKDKNKIKLKMFLFLILLSTLAGCSKNSTTDISSNDNVDDLVVLRLADNHAKDYPTVKADEKFADLVFERTNGKIRIDVYPEGALGDEESVIEQVRFGVIDLARVSISPLVEVDEKIGVLALPYLYRDRGHMFEVLDSPLGDEFRESLMSNELYGLAWYDAGARNFYNPTKEIRSPDDLKYLSIRVQESDLMKDYITNLGARPVPMVFSEVLGALQTGVINGAENNWPSYISTSHYKVAKYITVDEHIRIPELIIINKRVYSRLTAEQQQIIEECAKEAAIYQREEMIKEEKKAINIAIENGNVITELTSEELEKFKALALPIYEKFADQKEIIEKITNLK